MDRQNQRGRQSNSQPAKRLKRRRGRLTDRIRRSDSQRKIVWQRTPNALISDEEKDEQPEWERKKVRERQSDIHTAKRVKRRRGRWTDRIKEEHCQRQTVQESDSEMPKTTKRQMDRQDERVRQSEEDSPTIRTTNSEETSGHSNKWTKRRPSNLLFSIHPRKLRVRRMAIR